MATSFNLFLGQNVRVTLAGDTITGVTDGLEPNGALRLRVSGGSTTIIQAGDVERLRMVDDPLIELSPPRV